jgi:hypothetical protein
MTDIQPAGDLPIACTLPTIAEVKAQVENWRAFEADYALSTDRTDTELVIHYAKVADSIDRLRALVEVERKCCAFVNWSLDETNEELRLIVTGTPFQLAALNLG